MKLLLTTLIDKFAQIIARSRSNKVAKELLLLTDKQLKGLGLSRDLIAKGEFGYPINIKTRLTNIKTTASSVESQTLASANDDAILNVA